MGKVAQKTILHPGPDLHVGNFLNFCRELIMTNDPRQVIDRAISFYETLSPLPKISQLQDGFFTTIALEKEGGSVPLIPVLEALKRGAGHSYQDALLLASQAYVESTRYLFPMIFGFASEAARLSLTGTCFRQPVLFLRDGLVFWPAFLANQVKVDFLLYSRLHADLRQAPRLYTSSDWSAPLKEDQLSKIAKGALAIDVGLYGTLVGNLLDSGICQELGAFFFASRSPFIAGWLNKEFVSSKSIFDSTDIIRLADTMESLLKPFQVVETQNGSRTVPSDIISFCSSVLLLWSLYRYKANSNNEKEIYRNIEDAKRGNSWFVKQPVPKWSGADHFLRSWRHGALYPVGNEKEQGS